MSAMPTLYFVRHGETDWNAEARLQGQRDIALNDTGRRQAAQVGERLAALLPDPGHLPWLVSPLGRTRETAAIARSSIGLSADQFSMDDRLKELTFGAWEGHRWGDLLATDTTRARARKADKWGFVPPGGESYAMLSERVQPWLESLRHDSVIVSHGGVCRVLMVLRAGFSEKEAVEQPIWQGRVLVFKGHSADWF